jgi:hypothetical protein
MGDALRCRDLLAEAPATAADWVETRRSPPSSTRSRLAVVTRDGAADVAATLLGAAHTVRGAFDGAARSPPGAGRPGVRFGDGAFDSVPGAACWTAKRPVRWRDGP